MHMGVRIENRWGSDPRRRRARRGAAPPRREGLAEIKYITRTAHSEVLIVSGTGYNITRTAHSGALIVRGTGYNITRAAHSEALIVSGTGYNVVHLDQPRGEAAITCPSPLSVLEAAHDPSFVLGTCR